MLDFLVAIRELLNNVFNRDCRAVTLASRSAHHYELGVITEADADANRRVPASTRRITETLRAIVVWRSMRRPLFV